MGLGVWHPLRKPTDAATTVGKTRSVNSSGLGSNVSRRVGVWSIYCTRRSPPWAASSSCFLPGLAGARVGRVPPVGTPRIHRQSSPGLASPSTRPQLLIALVATFQRTCVCVFVLCACLFDCLCYVVFVYVLSFVFSCMVLLLFVCVRLLCFQDCFMLYVFVIV